MRRGESRLPAGRFTHFARAVTMSPGGEKRLGKDGL
jgi:hypothetical protein